MAGDDEEVVGGEDEIITAVSIKPPIFSETSSAMFFRVMEAQFSLKGITVSKTKFYHVMSAVPTNILENIPIQVLDGEDYDITKITKITGKLCCAIQNVLML